ncbi:hypothetical protein K1719_001465 [Acacia pycnantha]|nr:hypothetical protein K1719_001465 [Acacia pycnantha]
MKLNPNADSFFPSSKPNPTSMEPYHQGYVVVSSPSLVPPPPYYQQPYFYGGAIGGVHNLHPGNAIDGAKKQDDASKRFSKRGFLRHVITGYGRRLEARRPRGFWPPRLRCLACRSTGAAGCGRRIEEVTLRNLTRVKKTKQPLAPVERERCSTIMIRNIPNRYTRSMLIDFLDNHCLIENRELANEEKGERAESAFDLVYLPIDFDTRMNKGYGFVNFTNPEAAWRFYVANNSKKWEFFQSNKVRDIVAARFQGKDKLVAHLNLMKFPAGWDEVLPVCFSPPRDGTIEGSQKALGKLEMSLCNNNNNNYFSGGGGGGSSRSMPSSQWKKKKNTVSPEVQHASS